MQKKYLKKTFAVSLSFFSTGIFFTSTFAQGLQYEMVSYTANTNDATTPFLNINFLNQAVYTINYANFSLGVQGVFDFAIGISIAVAVVVFIVGAFQGILNQGSTKDKIRGKDLMQNSVIGLMIVLSTWLIINTINPDLIRLPILQGLENATINSTNNTNNADTTLQPPLSVGGTEPDAIRCNGGRC